MLNIDKKNKYIILMWRVTCVKNFQNKILCLRARDDTLTRETHRPYDTMQYPLMSYNGQDGYSIDISQVDPMTKIPLSKTVSAMKFYSTTKIGRKSMIIICL